MTVLSSEKLVVPSAGGSELTVRVYGGGSGPDLLYLHGAGGLFENDPFLLALCQHFRVHAPTLPGYEDSDDGAQLRHMLDFTLHAFDVMDALDLDSPILVGHSMGGMLAAEMAALNPQRVRKLVLLAPVGLWRDEYPVTDIFTALPFELPALLFADADRFGHLLSAGGDLNDPDFLTDFMVGNARRLGSAGKLLFPIPDRGLGDRLYRASAHTQILWGTEDKIIHPSYAAEFSSAMPDATAQLLHHAGHMLQYEQTESVVNSILALHNHASGNPHA